MPRFGTLRKLDLNHFDLRLCGGFGKSGSRKGPVFISATEIAATNFPNDVAAELPMMDAETALAGVMRETTQLGALVQSTNGVAR